MPRPNKYNWEEIKKAWQKGIDADTLSRKYGVAKKTLQNKAAAQKWGRLDGTLDDDIDGFRESFGKVASHIENSPEMADIVEEKISTIVQDNEIIGNNRKLAKAFQGIIGKGVREGLYKTPQDIKAGASTIKDLENIANPQASKTEITNTNAQQNVSEIKISDA